VPALRLMASGSLIIPRLHHSGAFGRGVAILPCGVVDHHNGWMKCHTYPARESFGYYFERNFFLHRRQLRPPSLLDALLVIGSNGLLFAVTRPFEMYRTQQIGLKVLGVAMQTSKDSLERISSLMTDCPLRFPLQLVMR